MLGRGSQGVSVPETMWCMGGHHASLDRDMFSLCVVGRKGGASLEGTTKGSAWPQDGGRHWKRTGKKLPEAMTNIITDSTCGRRQRVPGRRCSTNLTPPPGTPQQPESRNQYHPYCTDKETEAWRGTQVHSSRPYGISSWYTSDTSRPHGGCWGAGPWEPIYLPSCRLFLRPRAVRSRPHAQPGLRSNTLPTAMIHFYPEDTCDTNHVVFPHQQPLLPLSTHQTRLVLHFASVLTLFPELAQSPQAKGSVP